MNVKNKICPLFLLVRIITKQVSICAKDSGGPYNYDLVSELVKKAKDAKADYVIDIYPFYKSDAEVALRAGVIAKHALVGMGVYASHGYERTHINGIIGSVPKSV